MPSDCFSAPAPGNCGSLEGSLELGSRTCTGAERENKKSERNTLYVVSQSMG